MQEMKDKDVTSILVRDLLKEKGRDRLWKNIRFIGWFILIAYVLLKIFSNGPSINPIEQNRYTALVRLDGMIAPGRGFSAEDVIPTLHDAFTDKNAAGVIIDINSPGGTPVQAAIIHDAIITLKKKYHKKVVIVGEDLLTSGAYYVAVAGDKIYVNASTLTGSIGVVMKGFGFVDIMKKIGIERRVYVSGSDKDRLDPFLPQNPEDIKKVQAVMDEVRQTFAQAVLEGRKGKLRSDATSLFNGDFWPGETALQLGLVDGIGNLMDVMEKEFKTTTYKEYGGTPAFLKNLTGQFNSLFDSMFYMVK